MSLRRLRAVAVAGLLLAGCAGARPPMRTTLYEGEDHEAVVVLLPGLFGTDRSFGRRGVVRAARDAGIRADLVGVRTSALDYVHDRTAERLHAEVIGPLRARYDRVAVLGISLGGFGALRTAAEHPDAFDEVVVLSPFLGRRVLLDRIELDGGLSAWRPEGDDWDASLWRWLKVRGGTLDELPPVRLGRARHDAVVGDGAPLVELLDEDRVVEARGGHRWRTWRTLVRELAARGALGAGEGAAARTTAGR